MPPRYFNIIIFAYGKSYLLFTQNSSNVFDEFDVLEWQLQPGERKREAVWERMLRRGWGPP